MQILPINQYKFQKYDTKHKNKQSSFVTFGMAINKPIKPIIETVGNSGINKLQKIIQQTFNKTLNAEQIKGLEQAFEKVGINIAKQISYHELASDTELISDNQKLYNLYEKIDSMEDIEDPIILKLGIQTIVDSYNNSMKAIPTPSNEIANEEKNKIIANNEQKKELLNRWLDINKPENKLTADIIKQGYQTIIFDKEILNNNEMMSTLMKHIPLIKNIEGMDLLNIATTFYKDFGAEKENFEEMVQNVFHNATNKPDVLNLRTDLFSYICENQNSLKKIEDFYEILNICSFCNNTNTQEEYNTYKSMVDALIKDSKIKIHYFPTFKEEYIISAGPSEILEDSYLIIPGQPTLTARKPLMNPYTRPKGRIPLYKYKREKQMKEKFLFASDITTHYEDFTKQPRQELTKTCYKIVNGKQNANFIKWGISKIAKKINETDSEYIYSNWLYRWLKFNTQDYIKKIPSAKFLMTKVLTNNKLLRLNPEKTFNLIYEIEETDTGNSKLMQLYLDLFSEITDLIPESFGDWFNKYIQEEYRNNYNPKAECAVQFIKDFLNNPEYKTSPDCLKYFNTHISSIDKINYNEHTQELKEIYNASKENSKLQTT